MTNVRTLLRGIARFWRRNSSPKVLKSALRENRGLSLSLAISIFTLLAILLVLRVVSQNPDILARSWLWLRVEGSGTESGSTTIRNIGLVLAGVIALVLGLWRSFVAQKQADAANRQSVVAHQSLLNERYQQGAQMVGSEIPSVRLGGIYVLRSLAEQHAEEYHLEVLRMLCAFVRNPSKMTISEVGPTQSDGMSKLREDVQIALDAICACHERNTRRRISTVFWLDFHEANLNGARLKSVNLTVEPALRGNTFAEFVRSHLAADFTDALLRSAEMDLARLPKATFTGANLQSADLSGAELPGATLRDTDMRSAWLIGTDLSGARLWNADLSNAMLYKTNLTGTEFNRLDSLLSPSPARGLTQSQLDEATSDPQNPPLLEGVTDAETGKQLVWNQ